MMVIPIKKKKKFLFDIKEKIYCKCITFDCILLYNTFLAESRYNYRSNPL